MLSLGGDAIGGSGLGRGVASLLPWSYQVEWVHEGRVRFRLRALVVVGARGRGCPPGWGRSANSWMRLMVREEVGR